MCITPQALALFLNLLNFDMITMEEGRITVHAETRPAVWVETGNHWCTMAPQIDRMARFN